MEKLVIVLEEAPLDTGRVNKSGQFQLLNSEQHSKLLIKQGKNPDIYRPEITHLTLLSIFDSPLAKSGRIQLYLHTFKNVLIKISPHLSVPRSYHSFSRLIAQLLHKRKIKTAQSSTTLMKVIKNPITSHLPAGSHKILIENSSDFTNVYQLVRSAQLNFTSTDKNRPPNSPVFVINLSRSPLSLDYIDRSISVSRYNLTPSAILTRVCSAFEILWSIQ